MHIDVHSSIIHSGRDMEAIQLSYNRRLSKEAVVHIYNGILAIRRDEILPYATTWMDLEIIMLNEISQTEKVETHMISLILGIET